MWSSPTRRTGKHLVDPGIVEIEDEGADLVRGVDPDSDLDPFRIDRFRD